MDRLWAIAVKEVRTRFTDRNLLLIKGSIPGAAGGRVVVKKSVKSRS